MIAVFCHAANVLQDGTQNESITGIRQAKIKFSIHPFFLSSYFDWELENKSAKVKDTWLFLHTNLRTKIFQSTKYQDEEIFRAWVKGCTWVFTITAFGGGDRTRASQFLPSSTLSMCRGETQLSCAGILSMFKEKHEIFWTCSMCFLVDRRITLILSLLAETLGASNRVGEQAALFPCSSSTP